MFLYRSVSKPWGARGNNRIGMRRFLDDHGTRPLRVMDRKVPAIITVLERKCTPPAQRWKDFRWSAVRTAQLRRHWW